MLSTPTTAADDCGRSRCCRTRQLASANANTLHQLALVTSGKYRAADHKTLLGQLVICQFTDLPRRMWRESRASIRPGLWRSHNKDSVQQARLSVPGCSTSPPRYRRARSLSHRRQAMTVPRRPLNRSELGHGLSPSLDEKRRATRTGVRVGWRVCGYQTQVNKILRQEFYAARRVASLNSGAADALKSPAALKTI